MERWPITSVAAASVLPATQVILITVIAVDGIQLAGPRPFLPFSEPFPEPFLPGPFVLLYAFG
jgi:hypothetical protein